MNDNMEVNGKAVPKVHRPPSLIFRDDGNPFMGAYNMHGVYKCIDYRIPEDGDLFYFASEDCVIPFLLPFESGKPPFPRVIVERIQEREIEPTEGHA